MKILNVCIALAILTLVLCTPPGSRCRNKNPFLDQLQKYKSLPSVEIYTVPVINTQYCGAEWSTYGTCCDPEELSEFVELESKLIKDNANSLEFSVDQVKRTLTEITTVLSDLLIKHKKDKNTLQGKPSNESKNTTMLETLHRTLNESSFSDFKKQSQTCWTHMKNVRSNALCSVCSGRSEKYFYKKKIIVTESICQLTIARCKPFFTQLSNLIRVFPRLLSLYRAIKGKDHRSKYFNQVQTQFSRFGPPTYLIDSFKQYHNTGIRNQIRRNKLASNICATILSIRKKPYIMLLDPSQIELISESMKNQFMRRLDKSLENQELIDIQETKSIESRENRTLHSENKYHADILKNITKIFDNVTNIIKRGGKMTEKIIKKYKKMNRIINSENYRHEKRINKIKNVFDSYLNNCRIESMRRKKHIKKAHMRQIKIIEIKKALDLKNYYEKLKKNTSNFIKSILNNKSDKPSIRPNTISTDIKPTKETDNHASRSLGYNNRLLWGQSNFANILQDNQFNSSEPISNRILIMTSDSVVDRSLEARDGMRGTSTFFDGLHMPMNMSLTFP